MDNILKLVKDPTEPGLFRVIGNNIVDKDSFFKAGARFWNIEYIEERMIPVRIEGWRICQEDLHKVRSLGYELEIETTEE